MDRFGIQGCTARVSAPLLAVVLGLVAAPVYAQVATPAPTTADVAPPAAEPTQAPVEATTTVAIDPAHVAEAAAVPTTEPTVAAVAPEATEAPHATLDYSDGSFYLRSADDNIVFVPGARMHLDTYSFAGSGVSDYHRGNGTGLKTNLFFRRFVIEMGGLIRGKWFYWVGGNFAPTSIDDSQKPVSSANVYDGFVGYMPTPQLRVYFGQYNAPFTMENVTSSRWLDLMERALTIRTVATPYNKADGLTVWGETEHKTFEYQVGIFGGDGMNRPNIDNRFDGMARLVVRPLSTRTDALKGFHVGVGGRIGSRDSSFALYDAPSLSTPGGYAFWSSSYKDAMGAKVHVLTSGLQAAMSAEAYLPFERWDVRGEVVYASEDRREVSETDRNTTLRNGTFSGVGAYGQVSLWLLGTPRINGNPAGTYGVTKLPTGLGTQAPYALQLVLRGEMMRMAYDANARSGADAGGLSANTNDISVNAYQLGLNYWATKHVRLSAEYSLYHFPGSANRNQARAPGAATDNAHVLNELSFRVGLAL